MSTREAGEHENAGSTLDMVTRLRRETTPPAVVLLGWRWVSRREWSFAAPDSLAATCAVAGIVWWSCLRLGGFGLVLLAASTWLLVAERRRPHEDRSEIVV